MLIRVHAIVSAAQRPHRDDGRSRRTTRGEYLGRRLCLVELSMIQRRPALQVCGVDIGSCVDQNLNDRSVIRMRGRVQRSRAPVLIGVVHVHIAAGLKQVCDGLKMPFPRCAVQRCGPVCITHTEQAFIAREQSPKLCQIASLRRLDEFLRGSTIELTP